MESGEQKSYFDKIGSDVHKSEMDEMESVGQKSEVDTMGSDSQRSELNAMKSDEQKSEFYAMRSDDPKSGLDNKASDFDNKGSDEPKQEFDTDEHKTKFEKPQQSSRLQQNILPGTPNAKDVQLDSHKISQSSKQHKLVGIESEQAESTKNNGKFARSCEPCKFVRKENIASDVCKECEEFLCEICAKTHKMHRATQMHHLISAENVPQNYCEPCMSKGDHVGASRLCNQCEELLCSSCSEMHASFKATKSHTLGDIPLKIPDLHSCCPCKVRDKEVNAVHYCAECEEYYCTTCGELHGRLKATLSHNLVKVAEMGRPKNEKDYKGDDKGPNEKISEFDEMGFDEPRLKSQFERPQQTSHFQRFIVYVAKQRF